MSATAVVVTRDAATRRAWIALLTARGLTPTGAATASRGRWIAEAQPISLVLTEWSEQADSSGRTTADLLRALATRRPDIRVIVCDDAVAEQRVCRLVAAAHPAALLHDTADGAGALAARIDGLMGRCFGDLRIEGGVIVHSPTGAAFRHPLAVRMVLAHPRPVAADGSRSWMAVLRFRRWLEAQESSVSVVCRRGVRQYQLVAAEAETVAVPAVAEERRRGVDRRAA